MKISCTPHIKKVDQNKVIVQGPNTVRLGSGSEALRTRLHRTDLIHEISYSLLLLLDQKKVDILRKKITFFFCWKFFFFG